MSQHLELLTTKAWRSAADRALSQAVADIQARGTKPAPRIVASPAALSRGKTRIWDLHPSLHCSIIGTCLSTGELRRLLVRLGVAGAETLDDHGVHQQGV